MGDWELVELILDWAEEKVQLNSADGITYSYGFNLAGYSI
jgi:hypothetical protein